MTNGERIRSMTDAELVEFLFGALYDCGCCPIRKFCDEALPEMPIVSCKSVIKIWLKSEVKND